MDMHEESNRFFDDMAEDFFAECDELMAVIRRNLLRIDELRAIEKPPKALLEELLRSSHTLKGLAGMIGAVEIMKLTHTLENFLKAVYEEDLEITDESMSLIFSGVNMLEQQLSAFRNKTEMPDVSLIIKKIENLLTGSDPVKIENKYTAHFINKESGENAEAEYSLDEGETLWKFFFRPDKELFERGININIVRKRLQDSGRVLNSVPDTTEDGRITFEFLVASREPDSLFKSWAADGITFNKADEKVRTETITKAESGKNVSDKVDAEQNVFLKNVVRVDLAHLDEIMKTVGDLVISRARLNDHLAIFEHGKSGAETRGLQETNMLMERQLKDLRESIMKLRLVPVGDAFERMKFVVRDLIHESRKSISLELTGQETQIDKYIVEKMFDPLLHIVRNAVSHGIETTEVRKAAGKNPEGKIILKAAAAGDAVIFSIQDDGKGIDRQMIKKKAVEMGIIGDDNVLDDETLLNIICTHGFSTREKSDMASGRGVGMNVVQKIIRELGGNLRLESEKGSGTEFIIQLPLTLSIVDALIVSAGKQVFAVPLPAVNEVIRLKNADLVTMQNNEMISYRDTVLPLLRLVKFFNLPENNNEAFDVLVAGQGSGKLGIVVDRITGKREIVVRPLSDRLVRTEGIYGATELGEGKIVLILDIPGLLRSFTVNRKTKNMVIM